MAVHTLRQSLCKVALCGATLGAFGALGLLAGPAMAQDTEDGFTVLFDGESLSGWKVTEENPGSFLVEDGLLIARGDRAHLFYAGPEGDADFTDFELRLEVKTTEGSNSGVYFHTAWQGEGWPEQGHEAQVNSTHTDPRKTGSLYSVVDIYVPGDVPMATVRYADGNVFVKQDAAPSTDGEWFDYTIRVVGKTVTIAVDGQTMIDWTQPEDWDGRMLGHGTFALQAHDPDSEVHYRNIRVKTLD